jgi:hypothetical protein
VFSNFITVTGFFDNLVKAPDLTRKIHIASETRGGV